MGTDGVHSGTEAGSIALMPLRPEIPDLPVCGFILGGSSLASRFPQTTSAHDCIRDHRRVACSKKFEPSEATALSKARMRSSLFSRIMTMRRCTGCDHYGQRQNSATPGDDVTPRKRN
jgi:hypothetical protein